MARRRVPETAGVAAELGSVNELLAELQPMVTGERPASLEDFENLEALLKVDSRQHLVVTMCKMPDRASTEYGRWVYEQGGNAG